jgi:hypothetical protein
LAAIISEVNRNVHSTFHVYQHRCIDCYVGTLATNHLLKHPDVDVTLVNRRPVVSLRSST